MALQAYIAHKFSGQELEPGLKEGAFFDPTNFTFPSGVHICEVEIDPETGTTRIDRWTAVDDFGTLINPMIVEGQVHGGIAQGVGQALLEGAVYNAEGQLITASYMDYCMPRCQRPAIVHVAMTSTPCPSNPLGIKGCGEAGAIAAPAAVINAITDALGHENIAMPATPLAVWKQRKAQPQDGSGIGGTHVRFRLSPSAVGGRGRQAARIEPEAKLLAGGHTLLPTMKQRLANPRSSSTCRVSPS
jgi:carbon-monoxide dehydrogenase large subunit